MLLLLIKKYEPRYLAVVFDSGEETDRHREYPAYKAHRPEMPDEMAEQLPVIFEVTEALGIRMIVEPGIEADDLIASLARKANAAGLDATIVTGDKDFFQLLSDHIRIIRPEKGTALEEEIGPEFCEERFGLEPKRVIDLLALMGDSSDNIPGVKGIGEKTALKLLHDFGSLDALYERIDEVEPEHVREKLKSGKESAHLSRELVTLRDVDVEFSLPALAARQTGAATAHRSPSPARISPDSERAFPRRDGRGRGENVHARRRGRSRRSRAPSRRLAGVRFRRRDDVGRSAERGNRRYFIQHG